VEDLKSFEEFLERRFPESQRKAYYLMSIHEHFPPQVRRELKVVGWSKAHAGDDSEQNLITLCRACHADVH
jgi:hypothetical protein